MRGESSEHAPEAVARSNYPLQLTAADGRS
jgi:hypothetical protein